MEAETVHTDISKQDILNSLEEGLLYLNDNLDISEEDRELIMSKNAIRLFKLNV